MVFGIILKILGFPATLLCRLFNIPFAGKLAAIIVTVFYLLVVLMVFLHVNQYAILGLTLKPENWPWYIKQPYYAIVGLIMKLQGGFASFTDVPLEYKKQLNNDGGIGWVPYYGKPGRSCEEDQDCPTFQKCNENKCVIPPGVR